MNKRDYSKTVNLPKTPFPMKANLPQREPERLRQWEEAGLYAQLLAKNKGRPKYILHDGPPYANGDIHIGHVLNKILKDIIVKFKTMQGYQAPYVPGWDCHGMPIEHQLFKKLGMTKHEIEPAPFRKKARAFALSFVDIQKKQFQRLGVFGNWANPYLTLTNEYEAKIVEAFGKLLESGHVYRGLKPINWCPTCETALAEAEVEYQDHASPSIFVRFALAAGGDVAKKYTKREMPVSLVIWTTTPWTLASNVACALKPDAEYAVVIRKDSAGGDEALIVASARIDAIRETIGLGREVAVAARLKGKELEHVRLAHPFSSRESRVILGDFVSLEEGSGCVHIAPGHGAEDYEIGLAYNLDVIMPVDEKGRFVSGTELVGGLSVFEANKKIIETLAASGHLLNASQITHSYPHCWRCKKPLIFRATRQWFINVDHRNLRAGALEEIGRVRWVPEAGQNRIAEMVRQRPDWCLSRQRYWGVPIPIFYCTSCDAALADPAVVYRVADKVRRESTDIWFTRTAQEIAGGTLRCARCGGTDFKKETDILDVWFDSGVSHYAVLQEDPALGFPADLYLEGSDQHRGWFQSSLLAAVGIGGASPFRAVLTHGFVVDGEGKKMSKSAGNVVNPLDVLKHYGADILRLWVASCDYQFDVRISDEILQRTAEAYRKFRNTAKYLLGNLCDFNPRTDTVAFRDMYEIDRWALSRMTRLVEEVTGMYEAFEFHTVYRRLYEFCVIEMSSFYLDVLKDRLYVSGPASPERRSGQTALYEILEALTRLLSPLIPFTAEEIWSLMNKREEVSSVHLADWPAVKGKWRDPALEDRWERLLAVRDSVLVALEEKRSQGIIGNALEAEVVLTVGDAGLFTFLTEYADRLASIFIVSKVTLRSAGEEARQKGRDLVAEVVRSSAQKCVRCWNYVDSVGRDPEYTDLCDRCKKVVKEYCHIEKNKL